MHLRLTINGMVREADVPQATSLLDVLRNHLGLTGTHYGCGQGACGACYVLVDDEAVPACTLPASEAEGKTVVTIEGLAVDGLLHPVQQAFIDEDAMQCGACTPGIIISAIALLKRMPHPGETDVREALQPHLCRCGVYGRVIRAVMEVAR